MKEWILENTEISEEKYDKLINYRTVRQKGLEKKQDSIKYKLSYEHPFYKIGNFTYKKPSRMRCILFGIKQEKNYFIYKDIKFKVLAETIFKDKKDPYKESLYSKERRGTCFEKSIDICFNVEKSKIVTAMCEEPFIKPSMEFIHSFVTIKGKNQVEYVLDGTFNVIVEKETYLKLINAKIISEIESKRMVEDVKFLQSSELGHLISVPEYLCFPNEVNEGVKKYIKTR